MGLFFNLAQVEFRRLMPGVQIHNMLDEKTILLTGATGFFGRWILGLLLFINRSGVKVKVVAVSRNPEVFYYRYPEFSNSYWLYWVKADVCDLNNISGLKVDLV